MNEEQKKMIKAAMRKAATSESAQLEMARLFGDVYDKELPIPSVISAVADTVSADVGEDVDYLVPENVSEAVFTLTSDCNVTQTKVSPSSDQELSFTDLVSDERYTCLKDWLKGKHNVLKLHTDAIMENMNRQEEYSVIQLLNAGANAAGNTFTLDSGDSFLDYPKLVEMRKAIRRFGRRLVLITGTNVTEDIDLLDYRGDKQREHNIDRIVDEHIAIEDYSINIDGTPTDVIGANVAYLVAVSDSGNKKPILFARRKTNALADLPDTEVAPKERLIVVGGNLINVDSDRKVSRSVFGMGEYGAVLLNNSVVAKFTRS